MDTPWADKWNERYGKEEFAYGKSPNKYLKEKIDLLTPGSILFPAEGEGRNAVYAAKLGWNVFAFDISVQGKNKALQLAEANKVRIHYEVGELPDLTYQAEQFDAIALIYAHFPANVKSVYYKTLDKYLRSGGMVIFEAFSKKHSEYNSRNEKVGGPKDIATLFSIDEISSDFINYEIIELEEKEIELQEGLYHNGKGSVIRFLGRKK
jgi:cyclopropane fatty-acyl-phospholipid synthase-like methyltransferase